jgi:hypothetical protein
MVKLMNIATCRRAAVGHLLLAAVLVPTLATAGSLPSDSLVLDLVSGALSTTTTRHGMAPQNGVTFGRFDKNNPQLLGPKLVTEKFHFLGGRMAAGTGTVAIEFFVNSPTAVAKGQAPVSKKANPGRMAIGQERDAVEHPGFESFDGQIARFLSVRSMTRSSPPPLPRSARPTGWSDHRPDSMVSVAPWTCANAVSMF